ncbi:Glyoxalase-like domain protein [Bremerella volcania]|uniref:Bleomycin resistance protein n=1 Tax=Bremerella volcania TaxID=2527984 RepID=A0A518C786_9BACT|nr:VOC family protein [Bremerella volcania]QDU75090.1 Glyoxalase-like domain protein [Bremerella volcania]
MLLEATPVLRVTCLRDAEHFYLERLGFQNQFCYRPDPNQINPAYMGVERDGAVLHLSSFPGDGRLGGVVFITVDDVDRLHEEFVARGIPITLPPTDQSWRMREMYVKDTDQNTLRFAQSLAG